METIKAICTQVEHSPSGMTSMVWVRPEKHIDFHEGQFMFCSIPGEKRKD